MCATNAAMCTTDTAMCAKDAAMWAKDAAMYAKTRQGAAPFADFENPKLLDGVLMGS